MRLARCHEQQVASVVFTADPCPKLVAERHFHPHSLPAGVGRHRTHGRPNSKSDRIHSRAGARALGPLRALRRYSSWRRLVGGRQCCSERGHIPGVSASEGTVSSNASSSGSTIFDGRLQRAPAATRRVDRCLMLWSCNGAGLVFARLSNGGDPLVATAAGGAAPAC